MKLARKRADGSPETLDVLQVRCRTLRVKNSREGWEWDIAVFIQTLQLIFAQKSGIKSATINKSWLHY